MDDRRFDALVKAVAAGSSRRSMLKGLLGLGGAVVAGGTLLEPGAQAARRPTPTPRPPTCPGQQHWDGTECVCPADVPEQCGPDCCTGESVPSPVPGHSECCDNACCFGTCYGEELCCPTNDQGDEYFPLPPTHKICESIDGTQCCEADQLCCSFSGCCDTTCWAEGAFCCPNDPASFCRGGGGVEDICCVNVENDVFACCNGGTDARVCYDTSVEGACCTDADCGDPCQICNPETNICQPRCDTETQVCCAEQAGPGVCVTGVCCPGGPGCDAGQNCCVEGEGADAFSYCTGAPCECDRMCSDAGLDCCIINDVFVGCYDQSAEGACCTAGQCEYLNQFDDCIVGACTDFQCEALECDADQHCCDGSCSDLECATAQQCSSDADCGGDIVCCVGDCCAPGQVCVTTPQNTAYCEG